MSKPNIKPVSVVKEDSKPPFTLNTDNPDVIEYTKNLPLFSGVARSVQCFNNNKMFRDYRVVSLTIENGKVVHTSYSDPHCSGMIMNVLDELFNNSLLNLIMNWQDKRTLSK